MITIVLADSYPIIIHGVRALLENEGGFNVVGEASDGLEALNLVEKHRPDLLVTGAMMPGMNGIELARQITQRDLDTRVLVLSRYDDEKYVLDALRNGANGYALKSESGPALITAVREVAAGRRYLSPSLSERAIEAYIQGAGPAVSDNYDSLTAREREIMQLCAEGYTNTAIAERLSISHRTVETHRTNLMRKLKLRSQTDLIRYALRRGILPMER